MQKTKKKRESVTVVDAPFLGPSGGFKEVKGIRETIYSAL